VVGGVQRAARAAEAIGFDDLWVSDHLVVPQDQSYPTPYMCDPLQTLAFAAAATERVGLGTSVLVGPQYTSPLALANTLATLDYLSGGRLTVGIGLGWSRKEYEALHAPFDHRGERLDEIIELLRTAWTDDPATHIGKHYGFTDIRVLPKPAHPIPLWIGGRSDAAIGRAVNKGDGYHANETPVDEISDIVKRLRDQRPDESWVISMRMNLAVELDLTSGDLGGLAGRVEAYAAAGIQALQIAPSRGDLDVWLAAQENIARVLNLS